MMAATAYRNAARHYRHTDVASVENDPHGRVALVLGAILEALARAQRAATGGDSCVRGEQTSLAMLLLSTLRGALDLDAGGEMAAQLDALYDYAGRRLLSVAVGDAAALQEVLALMVEIKSGWDAIATPAAGLAA